MLHLAEMEAKPNQSINVGNLCLNEQAQQLLSQQVELALKRESDFTAWISFSDRDGKCSELCVLTPQPLAVTGTARRAISKAFSVGDSSRNPLVIEELGANCLSLKMQSRLSGSAIGGVVAQRLLLEHSPVSAVLWVAAQCNKKWSASEQATINALSTVLAATLDREAAWMTTEQDQQVNHRMIKLSGQVSDIFGSSGRPILDRFEALLDQCCTAFDMDEGYVTLLRKGYPHIQSSSSNFCEPDQTPDTPIDQTFSAQLIRDPMPLAIRNKTASSHSKLYSLTGKDVGRYIGCAVRFDGRVQGTIELMGAAPARAPLGQMECAILQSISMIIAGPMVLL